MVSHSGSMARDPTSEDVYAVERLVRVVEDKAAGFTLNTIIPFDEGTYCKIWKQYMGKQGRCH